MTRLFLIATLLATSASAQTPALETLYGSWETTRHSTVKVPQEDGRQVEFTTLYSALEISEAELTSLNVSLQEGASRPDAYRLRYPLRADGLTLALADTLRIELEPEGERLRARWKNRDALLVEELMDRAPPSTIPEALRGDWSTFVTDEAGVGFGLFIRIGERSMQINEDKVPARFAGGFLLVSSGTGQDERAEGSDEAKGAKQSVENYQAFAVSKEGDALVLTNGRTQMRLVPLRR